MTERNTFFDSYVRKERKKSSVKGSVGQVKFVQYGRAGRRRLRASNLAKGGAKKAVRVAETSENAIRKINAIRKAPDTPENRRKLKRYATILHRRLLSL